MKTTSSFAIALIAGLAAAAPAMAAPTSKAFPPTGSQAGLADPIDGYDGADPGYGRSPLDGMNATYLHSQSHAAHHYNMTYGRHRGQAPGHYSHGDGSHRSTATGGNPGGFSSRN